MLLLFAGMGGALAEAPATHAARLADANTAATTGDWSRVAALVDPLIAARISPSDLAEAHRLAGLASFFQQRLADAEQHFLAYLRFDLDGQLDPALYQPEVVVFFQDVRGRHMGELRARRPKQKRYWLLNLVPPGGQIQNGEFRKAYVIGGLLGVFLVGNVTSYLVLRSWCTRVTGQSGGSATCEDDGGTDHTRSASRLRAVNLVTGIGAILTYAIGVYDGVNGYRRSAPFVTGSSTSAMIGLSGSF